MGLWADYWDIWNVLIAHGILKRMAEKPAYALLGINPYNERGSYRPADELDAEIKKRYRELAQGALHPDQGGDPDRWSQITSAYNSIRTQHARFEYGQEMELKETSDIKASIMAERLRETSKPKKRFYFF